MLGARDALRRLRLGLSGIKYIPPNYAFKSLFYPGDVAIDVGTGDNPDFSIHLITYYGLECFAVDPTRKHASALRELEKNTPNFHYLAYALGSSESVVEFYESTLNVSGSLLPDHRNVVNDPIVRYPVQMVTLDRLLQIVDREEIAIMKLDIEGAEYSLIESLELAVLKHIRQLLVEFHHEIIASATVADTRNAISRIKSSGMKACWFNGRDCLFYW